MTTCTDLPPAIKYHLVDGNFPDVYMWFWIFGGICLIFCGFTIIPHFRAILAQARIARETHRAMLFPYPYKIALMLISLPLIICVTNFISLLNPITMEAMSFGNDLVQALCLYFSHILIIFLLGSEDTILKLFEQSEGSKYWASPPLGCCFAKCIKKQKFSLNDFNKVNILITQYIVLAPFLGFTKFFYTSQDSNASGASTVLTVVDAASSMLCMYGLGCLTTALDEMFDNNKYNYNINGKFKCLQLSVFSIILPLVITEAIGIDDINDEYTEEVMIMAWSTFVTLILMSGLSILFKRYFVAQDCEIAWDNIKKFYNQNAAMMSKNENTTEITLPTKTGNVTNPSAINDGQLNTESISMISKK